MPSCMPFRKEYNSIERKTLSSVRCAVVMITLVFGMPLAAGSISIFGYTHTSIGNAQLAELATTGALLVSNLSPSGKDGVSVDVAGRIPNNFDLDFSTSSLNGSTPVGSFMRIDAIGTVDQLFDGGPKPNQLIGEELLQITAPN